MRDRHEGQLLAHGLGDFLDVALVLLRQDDGLHALAVSGNHFLLEAADWQDIAAQSDLTRHRDIAANLAARQGRDHGRGHRDASGRAIFRHGALRQVDVDVVLLVEVIRQAKRFGTKSRSEEQEKMRRLQLEIAKKAQLVVKIPDEITVGELASRMKKTVAEVIKCLLKNGVMATVNQTIDFDTAEFVATELGCRVEHEVVVTIVPRTVTNPALTIEGFAKGSRKSDLTFTNVTANLETPTGYNCYEGTEATGNPDNAGNFKVGTTYSIAITLHPAANYAFDELDPGYLTVTINGEEQKAKIEKGPEFNGVSEYQAVVTATTADKDEPTLDLKDLSATYGDKLLNLKLDSCSASFNGQPVEGTFAWADEYNAETPVGDAGEQTFNVVFTPAQQEVYATVTGTVKVNVAKKQITFTKSDYEWKSINDDPYTLDDYKAMCFQYDKNEHGIEPTCTNNDISDLVEFEVSSNNKSTNVIAATVTAKVLLKDEYAKNYKFDKDNTNIQSATLKVLPIVVEGTGEYTHSVEVCYTTSSVDIPLSAFGLPDEVLNDTNNKYWMRTDAVVAGDVDVISGTPTSFDDTTRTLTLNLKNSLTKDDAGMTATVTLGLKVNNYETTNPGVEGIANKEEKLFILKLTVNIIEKEDAGLEVFGIPKTMVYGDTVRAGSPDGYYYTVKKEGKNATFSAMISDTAVVAFDDDEGLAAKGVGTATITCTYESDTTIATKTFTINVTPKGLTANVSHDPITYGDAAPKDGYTVEFNGLVNGEEVTYTVGTEYKKGDKVGNYKFTVELNTAVKNYKIDTVTGALVVNPKSIAAPSVTINDPTEMTYTGSPCVQGVSVKDSEANLTFDDISVTYENNINVGTATIIYTGKNNYTGEIRKNFKITEASITDDMIANIPSVTYNTRAHTPDVTVTFNGSTLEAGKDYDVAYTNNINAGTATVTVTGKGNFTGTASKDFAIAQAYLSVENQTVTHFRTETDAKSYALPADMFLADEKETGFTITVTDYAGDEIFTTAPAVNGTNVNYQLNGTVGTAFVEVKVKPDSSNYANASFTLTFVVNDKENVSGSISFPDGSAVYTGTGIKYENATISGYSGTLRYGYTPNASTGASLDASGLPLTVGTYTVAVTFNSDASFGYKTATFTITKATPTGTPGYTKLETSGKTLADAKLTVGTIRPAGTIAWNLPLTTVLEDGKAYAWTFTPADTHNYTILTGTLIPYVDDGMDYIPGVIGGNTGSFNFHDVSRLDYFYDAVKWAAENGIASGTGRYTFSPDAVCTRAQTVTFLWRAAGSPLPRYRVCPFTDVNPRDYYYDAVLWAVEQGITTGLTATTFGPDVTVSRGQVATFLYRAASASKPNTFNPFTDVKTTAYNYDAILWAYDNRITTGTSATTFSPNASCTRAQIVTFLWRASGSPEPKTASNPFTDVAANAYYCKAVLWAVENGITTGTSATTFSPDAPCTRAQGVTFLWRANGSKAASAAASFTDVASDAYYAPAVAWAAEQNVTSGVGNGLFSSDTTCTRAQIVSMLYRLR